MHGRRSLRTLILFICLFLCIPIAHTDPFPPDWSDASAVHFQPVAWPNEPANAADCTDACGDWKPYTRFQNELADARNQDSSNGGTSPQSYVNVASSCEDKTQPSVYYYLHQGATEADDVLMFRWRVEAAAHNYATGPNAGNYSSTNPWSSALWTVFFDVEGSGYRSLAAHLNGSSGSPAESIDMLAGIWGNSSSQSLDYENDPNVYLVGHNPTAFTGATGKILNFQNAISPTESWPNGAAETSWDYGTTRARLVSKNSCTEYFVDYQIPIAMLDASGLGGPKISRDTPIAMMFCTANSLNNPLQKDCAVAKEWLADTGKAAPFGDYLSFNQTEPYSQPIISQISAEPPPSCPGSYDLNARVQDTLALQNGEVVSSIQAVDFYYWYDANGDGEATAADVGSAWVKVSNPGTLDSETLNSWSASWDSTGLAKGKYLIAAQALDDNTLVDDGMVVSGVDNRTFSYLSGDANNEIYVNGGWATGQDSVFPGHSPSMAPSASENWYGNPDVTGNQIAVVGTAINVCGVAPSISLSASDNEVGAGDTVSHTITVSNPANNSESITLNSLTDWLPDGFNYLSGTSSGSSTSDPVVSGQQLTWTLASPIQLAAGDSTSLSFDSSASTVAGRYNNNASAETSFGTLNADAVAISVDSVRIALSIVPDSYSVAADGTDQITFTVYYANDSNLTVYSASISSTLPTETGYVSCSGGNSCSESGGTISWTLGDLAAGVSGDVSFILTVNNTWATTSLVASAELNGVDGAANAVNETASTSVAVTGVTVPSPAAFSFNKTASAIQVAPGGSITYTLSYENYGDTAASSVVISDTLPAGMIFNSCSNSCSESSGVVTWNLGTIAAGSSGSVTVIVDVDSPFTSPNPTTNQASLNWTGGTAVATTADVGVTGQACNDYYFSDTTGNVGTDGTQRLAVLSPVPTAADSGSSVTVTAPGSSGGTYIEALRFYQDPATQSDVPFSGNISTSIYIDRANGPAMNLRTTVYDYDSSSGSKVQLGQQLDTFTGSSKGLLSVSVATTGTLNKDHRLLWVFEAQSNHNTTTFDVQFQYGGTVTNAISGGTTTAISGSSFCVTPPANLLITSAASVSQIAETSTETVSYTLNYANTGSVDAANSILLATLPSGFTNCEYSTDNSSWFTCSDTGTPAHSFALGTITGGSSGIVYVRGSAPASSSGGDTLTQTSAIVSDQTSEKTVTTDLPVIGSGGGSGSAELALTLQADSTNIVPGDSVTYTVTVINIGSAAASNVVVSNALPVADYFNYLSCSDSCNVAGSNISWSLASLAAGASQSFTYSMQAGNTNLSAGVTSIADDLSVSADALSTVTSNSVSISLNANPNLTLSATATPNSGLAPADNLHYVLTVGNDGSVSATSVMVINAIPANTTYAGNLSTSTGSASFDTVNNRVLFSAGDLASAASATVEFDVTIAALPSGNTTISDSAQATAANAGAVSVSVDATASASAALSISHTQDGSSAYPTALVTANTSVSTNLPVDNSHHFSLGQQVLIGGNTYTVSAINSDSITLNSTVTANAGDTVIGSIVFNISYRHSGDAAAINTVLSESLPAGLLYYGANPIADTAPSIGASGDLTWNLGTVAVGDSGNFQVLAFPSGTTGALVSTATIVADNTTPDSASVTTNIGGLSVTKSTSTASRAAGEMATYTITLRNSLATAVSAVSVTDRLPQGFSYRSGSASVGGSPTEPSFAAADSDLIEPTWSALTVPASSSLQIVFDADISADTGAGTYQNEVGLTVPAGIGLQSFDPLNSQDEDVTVLAADEGIVSGYVFFRDSASGSSYVPGTDLPLANVRVQIYQSGADCSNLYDPNCFITTSNSDGFFNQTVPAGDWVINVVTGTGDLNNGSWVQLVGSNDDQVTVAAQATVEDHNGYGVLTTTSDVVDFNISTDEDTALSFVSTDFSDNFTDSQGGTNLDRIRIDSLPTHGTLTLNGMAVSLSDEILLIELDTLVYTPDSNYNGSDSFQWNATDGLAYDSASALVNITINAVPDAADSTITDVSKTLAEDGSLTFAATDFSAVLNDSSGGSNLVKVRTETLPAHGSLTLNGVAVVANDEINSADLATLVYTPTANYNGSDSFQWNAYDGAVYAAVSALVNLTITAVQDPATISNLSKATVEDSNIQFEPSDFLGAFTDSNGGKNLVSVRIDSLPANGTLTLNGNPVQAGDSIAAVDLANLVYTPDPGYSGSDSFQWNAYDGTTYADSAALVNLSVIPTNDAPLAADDEVTIQIDESITLDMISQAQDLDGDTLTIISAESNFGSVQIINNELVFTPDPQFSGVVEITYVISDGNGGYSKGTVIITVEGDGNEPTLTVPASISIDANALYTKVDLGVATAEDRFGNPLPVSLVDGITFFEPGINRAFWETEDGDGNRRVEMQLVLVRPLVSIEKDQVNLEGSHVSVGVYLNGLSPEYPLTIPFSVGGTADGSDHDLVTGSLVITSGTEGSVEFDTVDDGVGDDGETVSITLDASLNLGNTYQHVVTLKEGNVSPDVSISVSQSGVQRSLISRAEGLVTLHASVSDANAGDGHSYQWQLLIGSVTDLDEVDDYFTFDPLQLSSGLYVFEVSVTDDGSPNLSDNARVYVYVEESLPALTVGSDSDLDLIPDELEGSGDDDNDGVPNYLDSRDECNVVLEQVSDQDGYQIEGEPGVCLRRGFFTSQGESGGALLTSTDVESGLNQIIPDPDAVNVGGIFDYISYGLPVPGQTYRIVMPQRQPIPENAVYRKFVGGIWGTFLESGNDLIASAPGERGFCPPPGGSVWQPGLTTGHWCVQLSITDGGPNDDDGTANGMVVDPGGVAVLITGNTAPTANDSSASTEMDTSVTLNVLDNASDIDGDTLTVSSANVDFGSVVINGDNSVTYTPPTSFVGQAAITYSVSDGNGGIAVATVTVTVSYPVQTTVGPNVTTTLRTEGGGGGSVSVWWLAPLLVLLLRRRKNRVMPSSAVSLSIAMILILLWLPNTQVQAQGENQEPSLAESGSDQWMHPFYIKGRFGLTRSGAGKNDINNQFQEAGLDAHVVSFDGSDVGYSLGLGYWLDESWSLELGYLDLGQFAIEIEGNYSDPDDFYDKVEGLHPESAEGVYLAALYHWPLSQKIRLIAQGGLYVWKGDYETELTGGGQVGDNKQNSTDLFVGVGMEYSINSRWEVGAGWERYRFENHDVDFLNLGLSYRFGGKEKSKPLMQEKPQPTPVLEQEPVIEPEVKAEPAPLMMTEAACKLFQGTLKGVNFESGSANLTAEARKVLQAAAEALKGESKLSVEIQAHTDYIGSAAANQTLSEARANAVKAFLVERGISSERLTTTGLGESQPIADNQTAKGRSANRRVELKQVHPETPQASDVNLGRCP